MDQSGHHPYPASASASNLPGAGTHAGMATEAGSTRGGCSFMAAAIVAVRHLRSARSVDVSLSQLVWLELSCAYLLNCPGSSSALQICSRSSTLTRLFPIAIVQRLPATKSSYSSFAFIIVGFISTYCSASRHDLQQQASNGKQFDLGWRVADSCHVGGCLGSQGEHRLESGLDHDIFFTIALMNFPGLRISSPSEILHLHSQ